MIYEDGSFYEGGFLNGHKNGEGILYKKDGKIKHKGTFKDDKFKGK
jgi:hypothetical protein